MGSMVGKKEHLTHASKPRFHAHAISHSSFSALELCRPQIYDCSSLGTSQHIWCRSTNTGLCCNYLTWQSSIFCLPLVVTQTQVFDWWTSLDFLSNCTICPFDFSDVGLQVQVSVVMSLQLITLSDNLLFYFATSSASDPGLWQMNKPGFFSNHYMPNWFLWLRSKGVGLSSNVLAADHLIWQSLLLFWPLMVPQTQVFEW